MEQDNRNINIMIKNDEEEKEEIVLSFSTLLRKLKKYLLLWIVIAVFCVVAAFGYAGVTTHVKKPSLSALISFSFDGIEKGVDPAGKDFDPYSIKNPAVIESALTSLNMDLGLIDSIRQGITLQGLRPKDIVDRYTVYNSILEQNGNITAADRILEVSYFPTQYKVYFNYTDTGLADDDAVTIFNAVLDEYNNYFYKTYGYNESLGNAVMAVDYNDYDYSESVEVFSDSINTLKKYVRQLQVEDQTRFRSSATGYTFADLYESINTIETIDLDKISSYVTVNNLTKDKETALAYYEYRIKALTRLKSQYEEQLKSYNESIESYQKDEIIIFGNGTDDTKTQSTVASEQYDKMIDEKNQLVNSLAETKQLINYYKERQEALRNNPVGSSDKFTKVESELASLNEKINNLIEVVSDTSEDYYINVTFKNAYTVLAPATNTSTDKISRVIENAKFPLVVLEGVVLMLYFAAAFIETIVADSKKRKALAESKKLSEEKEKEESDKE